MEACGGGLSTISSCSVGVGSLVSGLRVVHDVGAVDSWFKRDFRLGRRDRGFKSSGFGGLGPNFFAIRGNVKKPRILIEKKAGF